MQIDASPQRQLRVIILESDHLQSLSIEKMLNGLGYYAIVRLCSVTEVLDVIRYAKQVFDLLIVNRAMATNHDVDLSAYCLGHPHVRNLLVYELFRPLFTPRLTYDAWTGTVTLSGSPDSHSLRQLLGVITSSAENGCGPI